MTSIGNSEYPEMTITEAVKVIEGIKQERAQTTTALGKVMGLTNVTTGFFCNKTAALSKFYGLIDRQKTNISLTALAKRIVYPVTPADRETALSEVANHVPLLSNLYAALGENFHELDFPTKLLELTGASHEELEEKGPKIERLYRDAIQYLGRGRKDTSGPESRAHPGPPPPAGGLEARGRNDAPWVERSTDVPLLESAGPVRSFHSPDGYYLRVVLKPEAIDEAIAVLTALRQHITRKQDPSEATN